METLDITLPIKAQCFRGFFSHSRDARGLVIFAHGSGSSRFSARNQQVARFLQSRGGRPDLAEKALPLVTCPVLLIVGELDEIVVNLNLKAKQLLTRSICELKIVRQASHLFEEPGTLKHVAYLSADWLDQYCAPLPHANASSKTQIIRT